MSLCNELKWMQNTVRVTQVCLWSSTVIFLLIPCCVTVKETWGQCSLPGFSPALCSIALFPVPCRAFGFASKEKQGQRGYCHILYGAKALHEGETEESIGFLFTYVLQFSLSDHSRRYTCTQSVCTNWGMINAGYSLVPSLLPGVGRSKKVVRALEQGYIGCMIQ